MRKALAVVPAIALLGLLGAGCGSDESAPSGPDVITLSVNGGPALSFSDDDPEVTIIAGTNVNDGINVDAYATVDTVNYTVWITLDAPLPTSLPATVAGDIVLIVDGWTYTGAVSYDVTSLGGGMGAIVEGTFPTTTLGGSGTITVSGSFRATQIN